MITLRVEGLDRAAAAIIGLGKQARFATAVALTRTAKAIREATPARLERDLDRPTAFTKRGLYLKAARPDTLVAEVGFMDRQAAYLKYQIAGGTRQPGPRGIKLPGNITLNAFGNIPRGTIDNLKRLAQDGTLAKGIARRLGLGNRRKGAAPIQLFYGQPAGSRWRDAPLGIWRRVPGSPGKLIPVIVFPKKAVRYRPRFDFARLGREVVQRQWSRQFATALDEAMRTAR